MLKIKLFFLTIGFLFLYFGVSFIYDTLIKPVSYHETEGVVIKHERSSSSHSSSSRISRSKTYYYVVQYYVLGEKYTVSSSIATNESAIPAVGEKIIVKYDTQKPHKGVLPALLTNWILCFVHIVIGGVFALIGIVLPRKVVIKDVLTQDGLLPNSETQFNPDLLNNDSPTISIDTNNELVKFWMKRFSKFFFIALYLVILVPLAFQLFVFKNFIESTFNSSMQKKIKIENAQVTTATVVGREVAEISDGTEYMVSIAEYTIDGIKYTVKSKDSSPSSIYMDRVGAKVKIYYDAINPENAVYFNTAFSDLISLVLNVIIGICIFLGLLLFIKFLK